MEIIIIMSVLFGLRSRYIARSKGYEGNRALLGGCLFGLFSVIYSLLKPKTMKKKVEESIEFEKIRNDLLSNKE